MRDAMLTTIDNPFDPFDDFDNWRAYDEAKGYHSCGYVARIAATSDALSKVDEQIEIEKAIDEIVDMNVFGLYKKVVRNIL